ncbi:uncharacterized protein LOC130665689 isoform X1 [Microplitis mediator]|uniref:uncharacterized protein LOC130665689 isoform X1 n=1 Tax=Microplitis mediator TaxID=375433 RepID=UPI0025560AEE|nr:uncharacterized protein LOC130665689 isoform X1 [Microplitis mediator]XP_057322167.1 uncharacterized protein LOC130665689 isoform X1 [Microplitis mediator]
MNYILLPSEITLRRAFITLDLKPGINNSIVDGLKKAAERMTDPLDRYCTVVVDETSIKPRLSYTVGSDSVSGFHDDGNGVQKAELADHATVFMLQQINKPGKQPLSFHFTHKPMNTSVLKALLTQILSFIVAAGMIPVAAVSDQGSTNRGAFNSLRDETPNNYEKNHFKINNYANKIYILYDIAHLIKTLKNNFAGAFENWFSKNPKKNKQEYPGNIIEINGIRGYWREIVNYFFQDDKCHLKEEHVFPTNKVKMGVRFASQVLSQTTAERLMQRAVADPVKNVAAKATSIIIKFLDMVIDSLNGSKLTGGDKKESSSRGNVTPTSQHWEFWPKAKKAISTLKFFRSDGKFISTPTPAALLNSLSAIPDLCQFLFKAGFKSINLRHLTQDGLENFFGLIKNLQGCNHKLTTTHFISAFKTSILTIFSNCNVRGANSEIESSPTIIQLQDLLTIKSNKHSSSHDKNIEEIAQEIAEADDVPRLQLDDTDDNFDEQLNLIFGGGNEGLDNDLADDEKFIPEKLLASIFKLSSSKTCLECKSCIVINNTSGGSTISSTFKEKILKAMKFFDENIKSRLHERNICTFAKGLIASQFFQSSFNCSKHAEALNHEVSEKILSFLIRQQCYFFNRNVELEQLRAANAGKIAELSGKAKYLQFKGIN